MPMRKLLIVLAICAMAVWVTGAAGRMVIVLLLLLFGPGYLLERTLLPLAAAPPDAAAMRAEGVTRPLFVLPTLWLGLSLSLVAVLYAWTTALGLVLTPVLLGILTALCGLGVAGHLWQAERPSSETPPHTWLAGKRADALVIGAFLLVFGLALGVRFVQIADLAFPPWVDSVHHALLIRIAAEQGQAPYSLQPYLPVENLPYHWGYHVVIAVVQQLSGLDLPRLMLWSGQLLNGLHVVTCAALAAWFWRRPVAGVGAGIIVGLISNMPAYYLSWGRYTQLTGLLLLPPLALAWHAWLTGRWRRGWLASALLLAGLSILHVRVLVFALALLVVLTLVWALTTDLRTVLARVGPGLGSGLLAAALAAPWIWHLVLYRLAPAVSGTESLVGGGSYNDLNTSLLWTGHNRLLVALALLAALGAVWLRSRVAVVLLGWVCLLFILANPGIVGLPPLWLITNDVVVITLFLPLSIMVGGGSCLLYEWLARWLQRKLPATLPVPGWGGQLAPRRIVSPLLQVSAALLVGLTALWGAYELRAIINPTTVFTSRADLRALAWAAEHTPPDARFLINTTGWFSHVDRGSDGGWWLMPLAGRWTSMPPVLYTYGAPDYVARVRSRSRQLAEFDPDEPGQRDALYELIRREAITHIYLGPEAAPISLQVFPDTRSFEPVYAHDGVTILAVREPVAQPE